MVVPTQDVVVHLAPCPGWCRPRVQVWHGTADATLLYPNFGEEVKQWTDVLHARLALTDHPRPTWTHTVYLSRPGHVEVDAYSVAGAAHTPGLDFPDWARIAIAFFGLTRAAPRD